MKPPIQRQAVSYETRLAAREMARVDLLVIHCTELPDMAMARLYAEQIQYPGTQAGAWGDYYIDTSGGLGRYGAPTRVAVPSGHAPVSPSIASSRELFGTTPGEFVGVRGEA